MKRITMESSGIAFQIATIIFIFSYSSSPVKFGEKINSVDKTIHSFIYPAKAQHPIDSSNAGNLYYAEKKKSGFLYTNLTMNIQGSKK
ncbi:hypothetical protein [Ferruginibacter sp. SUN106]|uniref:hypothetical protein n=1 Tax=Ferruginibacter sp. SUN106 TaxID=2978348 RepID=UPI003D36490B